jgi:hypothetical protein
MRNAIEITGPLTPTARDLFVRLEPSIELFDPEHKLWDYELVRDGTVVLSIGDYHDLQVGVPGWETDWPGPRPSSATSADVRFADTGHFALETHVEESATAIRKFLTQ